MGPRPVSMVVMAAVLVVTSCSAGQSRPSDEQVAELRALALAAVESTGVDSDLVRSRESWDLCEGVEYYTMTIDVEGDVVVEDVVAYLISVGASVVDPTPTWTRLDTPVGGISVQRDVRGGLTVYAGTGCS